MIRKLQQNTSRYGWTWLVPQRASAPLRGCHMKTLCGQRVEESEKLEISRFNFIWTALQFSNSTVGFQRVSWFVDHETCSTYKRPCKPFKLDCLVCTSNDAAFHALIDILYFALISNILLHFSEALTPLSSGIYMVYNIICLFSVFSCFFDLLGNKYTLQENVLI